MKFSRNISFVFWILLAVLFGVLFLIQRNMNLKEGMDNLPVETTQGEQGKTVSISKGSFSSAKPTTSTPSTTK